MVFCWASLTAGWMCSTMLPLASLRGGTSSAMPEKNGAISVVTDAGTPITPLGVDVVLVMKNSSVPTLMTAFWLLTVETRGLDSTCTSPPVLRHSRNAAKLAVLTAALNTPPNAEVLVLDTALNGGVVGFSTPVLPAMSLSLVSPKMVPPPVWPKVVLAPSAAQLVPVWS